MAVRLFPEAAIREAAPLWNLTDDLRKFIGHSRLSSIRTAMAALYKISDTLRPQGIDAH